jgi:uncharacterized membrane protein
MDLKTRARNILMQPVQEWRTVAAEPADVGALLRDYAAPLSAIPVFCGWIGGSVIGYGSFRVGLVRGFANAVVSWLFGLVGCWLAAIVIEKLAPSFASRGSTAQALKLVVYASTPVWLAGVLDLVPPLAVLILIAALYGLYLFYVGLPIVMHTPADKVIPYIAVSAIAVIVAMVVAGFFASAITGVGRMTTF